MQNQQQLLLMSSPNEIIVTIQQIYEIDTITLEELVEEFQQLFCQNQIIITNSNVEQLKRSLSSSNSISTKFIHLSNRYLKQWYHLAKIQLKQRQKIELFALKLIQEDINSDNHYFQSNIELMQKKKNFKKSLISKKLPNECSSRLNLNNIQINLNTPITYSQKPNIQLSINKPPCLNDKNKQKHQIFNTKQMKTLQVKPFNRNFEKDQKMLSKKEFLEMMKMKLNKGTDYKTGTFINQPFKKSQHQSKKKMTQQIQKRHNPQNNEIPAQKMKSKSVYLLSNAKVDNSSNLSTKQTERKKILDSEKLKGRYKTNSSYATSRQQGLNSISSSNNFSQKGVKNINKTQTSRTVPVSRIGKISVQQIMSKEKQKVDQHPIIKINNEITVAQKPPNTATSSSSSEPSQIFLSNRVEPQETIQHENRKQEQQKQKQTKIQEKVNLNKDYTTEFVKQQPLTKQMTTKVVIQNHDNNNFPIFLQNEDAYDGEPQVLQSECALKKEQNIYELQSTKSKQKTQAQLILTQQKDKYSNLQTQQPLEQENQQQQADDYDNQKRLQKQIQPFEKNTNNNSQNQLLSMNRISISQPFFNNIPTLVNNKDKPIVGKIKHHPYHLLFPTFYHLFHTLKPENASSSSSNKFSLPHLLKSIQHSLQSYFQKQVVEIAQNQLQNKIVLSNQKTQSSDNTHDHTNIEIKCITQLQFINSYHGSSTFDIDLSSFRERSQLLLKKIQNNFIYQQQFHCDHQPKNHLKQKLTTNDPLFYRVIRNKPQVYDIINTSFYRTSNWLELPRGMELQGCWNLLWTWSKPQIDFNSLIKFQKVNHFPGSKQLARKDLLKKNIEKIKKLSKKLHDYFDIIPDTYFLPGQNLPFIKKFRQSQLTGKNLWILKPVGLSRGRGISLVNKLQSVVFSQPIVMQKYINNPYLLDGYKFDLRIYVLVTSINPLQCFVYRQGFARVSTERYCNDIEEIDNKYVHLTNYSIQKDSLKSPGIFTDNERVIGGCKLTLRMLRQRLERNGVDWQGVWFEIKQVILKSLISCMKHIPWNPNCFQLFGYDIMLDATLKCWLIEVNSSPSLEQDFLIDQIIKQQLIDDTIEVVDPIPFNRKELLKVIKRRRREVQGMKSHVNWGNNSVEQLNQDLEKVLGGKRLRNYGEVKRHVNFQCVAPGDLYDKILKTVQHYTHDPFVKHNNFY